MAYGIYCSFSAREFSAREACLTRPHHTTPHHQCRILCVCVCVHVHVLKTVRAGSTKDFPPSSALFFVSCPNPPCGRTTGGRGPRNPRLEQALSSFLLFLSSFLLFLSFFLSRLHAGMRRGRARPCGPAVWARTGGLTSDGQTCGHCFSSSRMTLTHVGSGGRGERKTDADAVLKDAAAAAACALHMPCGFARRREQGSSIDFSIYPSFTISVSVCLSVCLSLRSGCHHTHLATEPGTDVQLVIQLPSYTCASVGRKKKKKHDDTNVTRAPSPAVTLRSTAQRSVTQCNLRATAD